MTNAREVLLASEPPRRLRLERRIGSGGQAVVYASDAEPDLAVKLYHQPAPDVGRRLEGMLRLARAEDFLTRDGAGHPELAWPMAIVRDTASERVIGYAMRRVGTPEFVPLVVLFNQRQRAAALGDVSWRFFVGVSRNLAGLVATLHERSLVLGDVSHANVIVSRRGYLTFLDCDSMQFSVPDSGERFPCLMLTAEYAAPELLRDGRRPRTPESDCFSLALVVCRLLLMGDHPCMGIRVHAPDDDESGVTDNIRDGYCHLVRPEDVGVPDDAFDAALLPPAVLQLARQTFGVGHGDPAARPSATEWLMALDDARQTLIICPDVPRHVYSGHLGACPWCERVRAGFADPFAPQPAARQVRAARSAPAPQQLASPKPAAKEGAGAGTVALVVIVLLVLLLILL